MNTALTIAGSDCSGGAGIQADLKTMLANGIYGMSVITALTAQNTTGVSDIMAASPEFVEAQLQMVLSDIMADSVKIGMLSDPAVIEVVGAMLRKFEIKKIVLDPVMVSTSGVKLIPEDAVQRMQEILFPIASVVTPNIPEAETFTRMQIRNQQEMEAAAKVMFERHGCPILLKGGHAVEDADDYLYSSSGGKWFHGKRIQNENTHGTGCTLSSAIASNLAKGFDLESSVFYAKKYLEAALERKLDLGKGSGPMDHSIFEFSALRPQQEV